MNVTIQAVVVEFHRQPLRRPMQISSGVITELTEARATVTVKVGECEGMGHGAIYLSDLWAWPDPTLSHEHRDAVLRQLCREIADHLSDWCGGEAAHPLELGLRLHQRICCGGAVPVLAQAMCGSPFDAAIHDAIGIALERSAFDFYQESFPLPGVDSLFRNHDACAAIQRLFRTPNTTLDAWWAISANDSLEADVAPWVRQRGYRCFKLKLLGRDRAADVARTVEVFRKLKEWRVRDPQLSVDTNEGNPDAGSVLDYLERLRETDAEAFAAVQYLEQPTSRDIIRACFDWRAVAQLKPVMLDEGLTSLELLPEVVRQGWSGLALKTCKGHSFALVAAAWAKENGLLLSLQDLTNPGYAAVHAGLLAAYVPMINGVELNSPQYTPQANQEWLPRLAGFFEPANGVHRLPGEIPVGLGSVLLNA